MEKKERFLALQEAHLQMMESYNSYMKAIFEEMAKDMKDDRLGVMGQEELFKGDKFEEISQSQAQLKEDLSLLQRILDSPFELEEDQIYKTNQPMKPSSEIWKEERK